MISGHGCPHEARLWFSGQNHYDTPHVGRRSRLGEFFEVLAQALVRRPVGLLALGGAVADVLADDA